MILQSNKFDSQSPLLMIQHYHARLFEHGFWGYHMVYMCSSVILESILWIQPKCTLYISSVSAQIALLPILGNLMAAYLPNKPIRIRGTQCFFSLNPGPFNLKEHVLITIFANSGSNTNYAVNIITIVKAFYHRGIHPLAAILLTQTTQVISLLFVHV